MPPEATSSPSNPVAQRTARRAREMRPAWVRSPFRRKNLSPRLFPHYVMAAVLLVLARPSTEGWLLGGALVLAGLALRSWAAGHLVKTDRLTVTGPYAHLRHPLYAGTLLMSLGVGVAAGPWGFAIVGLGFLPIYFLYYLPYKERVESQRLRRHYGEAYGLYRAQVPALIPRRSAWTPPPGFAAAEVAGWCPAHYRANDELGTVLGVAIGLALLALRPLLEL